MPRTLIPRIAPPAAALATALMLVAAAPGAAAAQGRPVTSIDTTITLGRGGVVDLTLVSGVIRVVGWSRSEVHVRASTEDGEITFASSPTRITLEQERHGSRRNRHGGDSDALYELSVPAGTRVLMRSTSGDLSARGTKGDVEARTVSGEVQVDDAGDHTLVESVSGDVRVVRVTGDVRARSVSGEVEISDVAGDAEGESVSGSITIRGARSKVARAETVSGDVKYDGTIDPAGRYDFHSHSGDVELVLPASTSASVSIATFSGDIESDFPMTLQPDAANERGRRVQRMDFKLGNGGPRINAETFSGDVMIRRVGGKADGTRRSTTRDRERDRDRDDDDDDEPRR